MLAGCGLVLQFLVGFLVTSLTGEDMEADLAMKEAALQRTQEPPTAQLRFQPSKRTLAFLHSL